MTLPPLLLLTDRTQCVGPLRDTVAAAVDGGVRAVVLREKDLPDHEREKLADELRTLLDPVDGLLVIAGPAGSAGGSDAVHLAARDPFPTSAPSLVGRSCHSAEELARAAAEGCDYVLISPVFPTSSKPGYGPALGLTGLATLTSLPIPPAYALGGVRPADAQGCLRAGARGIAVMGPLMRDPRLVPAYLAALQDRPGDAARARGA